MNKQITSKLAETLRMTAAVFLMLMLGAIYPTAISQVKSQSPPKATDHSRGGGPKEGIQVHGKWTIDVRNSNGSLLVHREFENGLVGAFDLAQIMTRQKALGLWMITLGGSPNPCGGSGCIIGEPALGPSTSATSRNLVVGMVGAGVELKGSFTAVAAGSIVDVGTMFSVCPADTAPQTCAGSGVMNDTVIFTGKTLAAPIPVEAEQSVQVKVVISFS